MRAGIEVQFGLERRARNERLREGLVGKAELQHKRHPTATLAHQPCALLTPAILVVNPLSQRRPTVRDMLATDSQFIVIERPADELAHILAKALVEHIQTPVRLNQQRETSKFAEQLCRPVIRSAWNPRDAP